MKKKVFTYTQKDVKILAKALEGAFKKASLLTGVPLHKMDWISWQRPDV